MKKRGRKDEEAMLEELVFGKTRGKKDESTRPSDHEDPSDSITTTETESVWKDDEEEELEVNLAGTARLKKLMNETNGNAVVSGKQFSNLLRGRFSSQNTQVQWTEESAEKFSLKNQILSQSSSIVDSSQNTGELQLPSTRLNLRRVMDANFTDPSHKKITSIHFHSSGSLMLSAGYDRVLRIFKVDGEKNEKQLSVRFNDMAICSAQFSSLTNEVILGGRKPYFYTYDMESGSVSRIPGLFGKNLKSHEKITVSSGGTRIAIMGSGGYSHIIDGRHKYGIMDVKTNSPLRSQCFLNDQTLMTSGLDAEVYIWDLRMTARCLQKFHHEDGMCTSSLDAAQFSNGTSHIAVGSESGVVSVYQYHNNKMKPTLLRSIMNLTTKINCTKFHPSGQMLAIASDEKIDQLRVVHIPSCQVFSNWPTENTPTRKVECIDYSPNGGYMAIGNNKGKVLLYRLNHFENI